MDYDFNRTNSSLNIPKSAYRPIKRCPYCHSVFITEKSCESCGRSMLFHPIGEPFGAKSFYGIKERYILSLNPFLQYLPQFENVHSPEAQSYIRKLSKRFEDLIMAFNSQDLIHNNERKLFYIEAMEIIDELLRYGFHSQMIQALLEDNDNSLIGQELLYYLEKAKTDSLPMEPWTIRFLNYKLWGLLNTEFLMKAIIISFTLTFMAVRLRYIISSQFGK